MAASRAVDSSVCKEKTSDLRLYSSALSSLAMGLTSTSASSEGDAGNMSTSVVTAVGTSPVAGVLSWPPAVSGVTGVAVTVVSMTVVLH